MTSVDRSVGVPEAVYDWLKLLEDVVDGLAVLSVALYVDAEQFGQVVLLDDCFSDADVYWLVFGEEGGADCFCWVGDEVVDVEVLDEVDLL